MNRGEALPSKMAPKPPRALGMIISRKVNIAKMVIKPHSFTPVSGVQMWIHCICLSVLPEGAVIESYRNLIKLSLGQRKMNLYKIFLAEIHPVIHISVMMAEHLLQR
jgi:hypothetical protein